MNSVLRAGERQQFAELRRTAPVFWVDQTPEACAGFEDTPGYFAVSKHADVSAAAIHAAVRFAAIIQSVAVALEAAASN